MKNFWQKLNRPIIALAPMAGITDAAFRFLCGRYGADVVYSEMISAAGLFYDSERTSGLLDVYPSALFGIGRKNGGAKYVVQLFGNNPEHFAKAVKIIEKKIKPDGIDINFGCPVPKVQRAGAGVKLFQDLDQAHRVVEACLRNTKLPISVKVRTQAGKVSVLNFIEKMKDLPIAALMVHGRTLNQGFSGVVDYKLLNRAKKKFSCFERNRRGGIFLANGGINNFADAEKMLNETGADGIGIGQGACGNPQIFEEIRSKKAKPKNRKESFKISFTHAKLMEKMKGKQGILEMRKHLCWYAKGIPGAAEMRKEFVKVETLEDIKRLLKQ